jgi:hypothetical protein
MGQITHDQANLLLRLYELRRESRLREARTWFYGKFEASLTSERASRCRKLGELIYACGE